jgi:hypothetical protein
MKPSSFFVLMVIFLVVSACNANIVAKPTDSPSAVTFTTGPDNTATNTPHPTIIHTPLVPTEIFVPTKVISACPGISISWQATPSAEWLPAITATLPVKTAGILSAEDIAVALFCQYLEHYKSPQADISMQLIDYQVYKAPLDEKLQFLRREFNVDFIAGVLCTVLPTRILYSGWAAGNGEISNDGWIRNIFLIVGIFKHDDVYEMKIIGTGP